MKGLKRNLVKFVSIILACGFIFTTFACDGVNVGSSIGGNAHEIWSAPATQKIMRDVQDYDLVKSEVKIDIDSAKGEYELAQIGITADGNVKSYDVAITDLVQEDGQTVYSKDNITVYNAKYIQTTVPYSGPIAGWYPDALLKFDAAKEAGENKVAAGENQSIYFSFNVPVEQASGTYKGTFTLTVDGKQTSIPVTLRVRTVTVSQKVNVRSFFINTWTYYLGELGDTQEILDKYTKSLFNYRISPTGLVSDYDYNQEGADFWTEKVVELCKDEKCSTIGVPFRKTADGNPGNQFYMFITTLADRCVVEGYDFLDKCYVYGVDEPVANNAFDKTKAVYEDFMAQRQEAVDYLLKNKDKYFEENENLTEEFFEQLVYSLSTLRCVTTTGFSEAYDPYVDLWCPTYKGFEAGIATGVYDNEDEIWFYGALSPKSPYPTYHLDDTALSPRILGWLQGIYDVQGNLYWATNVYAKHTKKGYQYLDDIYSEPARIGQAVGDGFLFYPGKYYGLDEPVPSIRIDAIRDGLEEFELIYAIKELYKQVSNQIGVEFTADATIKDLASSLYVGMQITANNDSFKESRNQLLNLSEFTTSGICFTDYVDDGEGHITYKLYVPSGASLSVTGAEKLSEQAVNGGNIVTYSVNMATSTATSVLFTTQIDGVNVVVERKLPGRVVAYGGSSIVNYFVDGDGNAITATVVDGQELFGEEIDLIKFDYTEGQTKIRYADPSVLTTIKSGIDKVIINFYSNTDADVPVKVFVKYTNKVYKAQVTATEVPFHKGKNVIEWSNLTGNDWDKIGDVEYIEFNIGNDEFTLVPEVYIKNIVLYAEGGAV